MKCEHCGGELPDNAKACPSCGKAVGLLTKTGDVAEQTGEAVVDVTKKVGKGALRLGGKALTGLGNVTKKAGKKIQEAGEEKKE